MKLYNSLTKQKETFKPLQPGVVKLYKCGVTVYDYCHIGHGRSMLVFDMVVRFLRSQGWQVEYVCNITDIEDKIIKRAHENNEPIEALTARFIQAMHEDQQALGLLPADKEPRATHYMPQMLQLVQQLLDKGVAYQAENGDVYFAIDQFAEYGKLSNRKVDEMEAGARIEITASKRNPLDFVLWKKSKAGEPQWDSPWGAGRPGWHLECSAMAVDLLGQPFDIHGGGMDLKFPHHENEIAQSEAACHKPFANYWLHNGLLNIDGDKMSKSLNNFFTIRDVLKDHHAEVVRYFMLSAHYRSPISYSVENLLKARQSLKSLYLSLRDVTPATTVTPSAYSEKFNAAMNDDFNSPQAFAVLFEMAHELNRRKEKNEATAAIAAELKFLAENFGLLNEEPLLFLQGDVDSDEVKTINDLIAARTAARHNKDWAAADKARDALVKMGVVIEDTPQGTKWRR